MMSITSIQFQPPPFAVDDLKPAKPTIESNAKITPSPGSVTISSEASRLFASDPKIAPATHDSPLLHRDMREFAHMLHGDPDTAAMVAKGFAYEDYTHGGIGGLLDISGLDVGGDGILRYTSGEPVTEESKAYFNKMEASFRQERIKIYESEIAKGTPPAEIYDKLVTALYNQPERFLDMLGWPKPADLRS